DPSGPAGHPAAGHAGRLGSTGWGGVVEPHPVAPQVDAQASGHGVAHRVHQPAVQRLADLRSELLGTQLQPLWQTERDPDLVTALVDRLRLRILGVRLLGALRGADPVEDELQRATAQAGLDAS